MPSPIEDHRESVRAFLEARLGATPAAAPVETPVEPAPEKEQEVDMAQAAADILMGVGAVVGLMGR